LKALCAWTLHLLVAAMKCHRQIYAGVLTLLSPTGQSTHWQEGSQV